MRVGDGESWHPVASGADDGSRGVAAAHPARLPPLAVNWFGSQPELRRDRERFDARRPAHWLAGVVMGVVWLLLGANALLSVSMFLAGDEPAPLDPAAVWVGLALNLALFVGAPLVWVAALYRGGTSAWGRRLQLQSAAPLRDAAYGVGLGLAGIAVSWAVVLLTTQFTTVPTDNPVVETLAEGLTWPLVFFIAVASSVSEEVLFRGLVQPRIGLVATSVVFGVVHLSYGTPLQVLIPLVLGVMFGWAVLRTRSLLPAVVAHFTFNFVQLVLAKLYADGVFGLVLL